MIKVDTKLHEAWKEEYESENGTTSDALWELEVEYRCCGFWNKTDMVRNLLLLF